MTPAGGLPPNPFAVQGLPESRGALRPWDVPEHGDLYLPMDHTQEAYERFAEFVADPSRDLADTARLVVVTGGRGSGKTSLINRCVYHIKRALPEGQLKTIDVTRHKRLEPGLPGERRGYDPALDNYLDRLAHHVLTKIASWDENFTDPGPTVAPAASAYAKLSAQLRARKKMAAILLPAFLDQVSSPRDGSEPAGTAESGEAADGTDHPVQHYMEFRNRQIIFFAESRNPEAVLAWHRQLDEDDRAEVLILRLGPLNSDDGWTFVEGRLDRHQKDSRIPKVSEHMMRNLVADRRSMTLSHLRQLCFDLWKEAIDKGTLKISDEDVVRLYDARADTLPLRRPRPDGNQQAGPERAAGPEPAADPDASGGGGVGGAGRDEAGDETDGQ